MTIGFMDSGIGGLSVLEYALKKMPQDRFLFYADKKNVPYGEKSIENIVQFVDEIVAFLRREGADIVVIACNTATSAAVDLVRAKYDFPIVGMEPAVKKAVECYGDKRVLMAATPVTVRGKKMQFLVEKVDKKHLVDMVPLPGLVAFAEEGEYDSERVVSYLRDALMGYELTEYGSVVLGCTHFNYFKNAFCKVMPQEIQFVDGIEGTVNQIIHKMGEVALDTDTSERELQDASDRVKFYYSGELVTQEAELDRLRNRLSFLEKMREI